MPKKLKVETLSFHSIVKLCKEKHEDADLNMGIWNAHGLVVDCGCNAKETARLIRQMREIEGMTPSVVNSTIAAANMFYLLQRIAK